MVKYKGFSISIEEGDWEGQYKWTADSKIATIADYEGGDLGTKTEALKFIKQKINEFLKSPKKFKKRWETVAPLVCKIHKKY